MSKLNFQAKIGLTSAVAEDDLWKIEITFRDAEGVFQGRGIEAGDVLVLNTAVIEPGTYTRFTITEVVNVDWLGGITLRVKYAEDNDNASPNPPMDFLIGLEGIITRPSPNRGLLPVVSPETQGIPDAFSFYTLNWNLTRVLDEAQAAGGNNARLYTTSYLPVASDGKINLPRPPLGDFVFNMAFVYLADGSIVEVIGVKPTQDPDTLQWYTQIPSSDMKELGNLVGAVQLTYLIDQGE